MTGGPEETCRHWHLRKLGFTLICSTATQATWDTMGFLLMVSPVRASCRGYMQFNEHNSIYHATGVWLRLEVAAMSAVSWKLRVQVCH